jgi:transketolase C-terminal domain/subunit
MKKIIFTAIALVAVSDVSMANSFIDENESSENLVVTKGETVAAISVSLFEEEYHNSQVNLGIKEPKCIDSFTYNALYYAYLSGCK